MPTHRDNCDQRQTLLLKLSYHCHVYWLHGDVSPPFASDVTRERSENALGTEETKETKGTEGITKKRVTSVCNYPSFPPLAQKNAAHVHIFVEIPATIVLSITLQNKTPCKTKHRTTKT